MFMVLVGCSSASNSSGSNSSDHFPPWKQVWADDFNGPVDGSVNTSYWGFDTDRGIFGTGEVETMTSSRYKVHLDGHGDLDLIVLGRGAAGSSGSAWTSGRMPAGLPHLHGDHRPA